MGGRAPPSSSGPHARQAVARLVKYLSSIHESQGMGRPQLQMNRVWWCTWAVDVGVLKAGGYPCLGNTFEASLGYMRKASQKQTTTTKKTLLSLWECPGQATALGEGPEPCPTPDRTPGLQPLCPLILPWGEDLGGAVLGLCCPARKRTGNKDVYGEQGSL